MTEKKRADLIESICGGAGSQFGERRCLYYVVQLPSRQCRLLKNAQMTMFWEQCRAAYFLLYDTVSVWNKTFKKRYPGLPIDEAEDFDFDGVKQRLEHQHISIENLAAWWKYVNKTVYLELKKTLIRRGWLPEKRNCGSCKSLSASRPYVCEKTGEPRNKTALPCEDYRLKMARFIFLDENPSDGGATERYAPDRILFELINTDEQMANTPEAIIIAAEEQTQSPLSTVLVTLARRPEDEKPGSKKEKKYERHYAVFTAITALLAKGHSKEEAVQHLAHQFAVNEKTIRRDLGEIKEFLREQQTLAWLT